MIEAITFDFGNTLVPVPAAGLRGVVAVTADRIAAELGPFDREAVLDAWAQGRVPLLEYPAGSDGPTTAPQLSGGQHG